MSTSAADPPGQGSASLQLPLQAALLHLARILAFQARLHQQGATHYAPRAPAPLLQALKSDAAAFTAACDHLEHRILRALATLERDARTAAGLSPLPNAPAVPARSPSPALPPPDAAEAPAPMTLDLTGDEPQSDGDVDLAPLKTDVDPASGATSPALPPAATADGGPDAANPHDDLNALLASLNMPPFDSTAYTSASDLAAGAGPSSSATIPSASSATASAPPLLPPSGSTATASSTDTGGTAGLSSLPSLSIEALNAVLSGGGGGGGGTDNSGPAFASAPAPISNAPLAPLSSSSLDGSSNSALDSLGLLLGPPAASASASSSSTAAAASGGIGVGGGSSSSLPDFSMLGNPPTISTEWGGGATPSTTTSRGPTTASAAASAGEPGAGLGSFNFDELDFTSFAAAAPPLSASAGAADSSLEELLRSLGAASGGGG